jgi:uncharacterized Zn finger protein
MCKHVAAVLYGVGARLDEKPALLFELRGVDENELLASAGRELSLNKVVPAATKVLDDNDVAALFGLEMAEAVTSETPTGPERPQKGEKSKPPKSNAGNSPVSAAKRPRKRAKRQGLATAAPTAGNQRKKSKETTAT